jgi:ATP-dependent helicase HrpB
VRLVCGDARDDRAERRVVERVRDRALDIARRARIRVVLSEVDAAHAGSVLALGFPDRVAVRRSQLGQFQLRTGGGAWVGKDDPLACEPFVVAADLDGNRTSARIRLAASTPRNSRWPSPTTSTGASRSCGTSSATTSSSASRPDSAT